MGIRLGTLCITLALASTTASAQGPALDATEPSGSATDPAMTDPTAAATAPTDGDVQYGVSLRLRNVRVPKSIIELFVEESAGGASNFGYGIELTRRRGNVELQLGLEYENVTVGEGTWINKDEPVPAFEADWVLDPENAPNGEKLGWFTIEFTFLNHAPINKNISFRYGGGAGLGIITGNLYRRDVICAPSATNASPDPGCRPQDDGGQALSASAPQKYNLPPVFPVVNAIIGFQIKPVDKMVINIEGGIRTLPFFGTSIGYFF